MTQPTRRKCQWPGCTANVAMSGPPYCTEHRKLRHQEINAIWARFIFGERQQSHGRFSQAGMATRSKK